MKISGLPLFASALLLSLYANVASAQSCGEIGGDYCSQDGSCPGGYNDLGSTYDCNPCCQQAQSGPSCGDVGGDYCSQNASCPSGYTDLGQTYDCNPCCQARASCEAIGGNYCSQSGSCPMGYRSLGQTSDCSSCCQQMDAQSMTGYVYNYSDSGTDFSIVWGRGVTDADYNTYGHQYREVTTISSPKGRTATSTGSPSTIHSEALVSLPFDRNDLGEYTISTTHFEWCPIVHVEWQMGMSFSRPRLGMSGSCWDWYPQVITTDIYGHYVCKYNTLRVPCAASCIPQAGVPTYHWDESSECPPTLLWLVPYIKWSDGTTTCSPAGEGAPSFPSCYCGDITQ